MECKNCDRPLRTDYSFCSNCGAKVIRNRLTLKKLWYDVTERYFNVDNTFLKTIWTLFARPEVVIDGYIKGVRKKFLNPISYYAIAITITGLLFFLIKEYFMDQLSMEWMAPGSGEQSTEIFNSTLKYQSIISVVSIPIYALLSKLMFFRNKKLNYTEHIVAYLYLTAQYTITIFPIFIIFLLLGYNYLIINYIGLCFMIIYIAYALKRIFNLTLGKIIWKTIVFLFLLFITFFLGTILFMLLLYLTGGTDAIQAAFPQPK